MTSAVTTTPRPAPPAVETFTVKVDGKAVVAPELTPAHARGRDETGGELGRLIY